MGHHPAPAPSPIWPGNHPAPCPCAALQEQQPSLCSVSLSVSHSPAHSTLSHYYRRSPSCASLRFSLSQKNPLSTRQSLFPLSSITVLLELSVPLTTQFPVARSPVSLFAIRPETSHPSPPTPLLAVERFQRERHAAKRHPEFAEHLEGETSDTDRVPQLGAHGPRKYFYPVDVSARTSGPSPPHALSHILGLQCSESLPPVSTAQPHITNGGESSVSRSTVLLRHNRAFTHRHVQPTQSFPHSPRNDRVAVVKRDEIKGTVRNTLCSCPT